MGKGPVGIDKARREARRWISESTFRLVFSPGGMLFFCGKGKEGLKLARNERSWLDPAGNQKYFLEGANEDGRNTTDEEEPHVRSRDGPSNIVEEGWEIFPFGR